MSKSLNNGIYLKDTEETVNKKIRALFTDPDRIRADIPGKVEGNPLFIYHDTFNPYKEEVEEFKDLYRKGKIGDMPVKKRLMEEINKLLSPFRKVRKEYEGKPAYVREILLDHTSDARKRSRAVLGRVKKAMKMIA